MEMTTILTLVSLVMGLLALVLGAKWVIAKKKVGQLASALKEGYDVGKALSDAIADDKITTQEGEGIKKEFDEFWIAIKALFSREVQ